jgi:hypothetical protein
MSQPTRYIPRPIPNEIGPESGKEIRAMTDSEIQRFWEKVNITAPDKCWLWKGASLRGYGRAFLNYPQRKVQAHRVAYAISHGKIPSGKCICHRCDVTLCVNPSHLFVGTHQENIQDRTMKGRGFRKITDHHVDEIRKAYAAKNVTQRKLADEYGVSVALICRIINMKIRATP